MLSFLHAKTHNFLIARLGEVGQCSLSYIAIFRLCFVLVLYMAFSMPGNAQNDSIVAKSLQKEAIAFLGSERYDSALVKLDRLYKFQQAKFPKHDRANPAYLDRNLTLLYRAICLLRVNKTKDALLQFDQSLKQLETNPTYKHDTLWHNSRQHIKSYIAECYTNLGLYDVGVSQYLDAEKIALALPNSLKNNALSHIYANLADNYRKTNNWKGALLLHQKALSVSLTLGERSSISIDYLNLAINHDKLGHIDSSEYYFRRLFASTSPQNTPGVYGNGLVSYAELLLKQGNLSAAIDTLQNAICWLRLTGQPTPLGYAMGQLAKAYFMLKKPKQALVLADSALAILPEESKVELVATLKTKSNVLQSLGRFEQAIVCYKQASIMDSIRLETQRLNYIDGMMVHTQVKEKEAQLREAAADIAYEKNKAWVLLTVIVLLFILLFAVYKSYHWQKKAHKAEAIKAATLEAALLDRALQKEVQQNPLDEVPTEAEPIAYLEYLSLSKEQQIPFNDILYIKAADNYSEIHTTNGKKIMERITLKGLAEMLPLDQFGQVHRSYIVNYQYVEKQRYDYFLLVDGTKIPRPKK